MKYGGLITDCLKLNRQAANTQDLIKTPKECADQSTIFGKMIAEKWCAV